MPPTQSHVISGVRLMCLFRGLCCANFYARNYFPLSLGGWQALCRAGLNDLEVVGAASLTFFEGAMRLTYSEILRMLMRHTLRILVLFAICLVAKQGAAQARLPVLSLCDQEEWLTRTAEDLTWTVWS
jgi:hypothetical protein